MAVWSKSNIKECNVSEYWDNMMYPISSYLKEKKKNRKIKTFQMAWEVFVISMAMCLKKPHIVYLTTVVRLTTVLNYWYTEVIVEIML